MTDEHKAKLISIHGALMVLAVYDLLPDELRPLLDSVHDDLDACKPTPIEPVTEQVKAVGVFDRVKKLQDLPTDPAAAIELSRELEKWKPDSHSEEKEWRSGIYEPRRHGYVLLSYHDSAKDAQFAAVCYGKIWRTAEMNLTPLSRFKWHGWWRRKDCVTMWDDDTCNCTSQSKEVREL